MFLILSNYLNDVIIDKVYNCIVLIYSEIYSVKETSHSYLFASGLQTFSIPSLNSADQFYVESIFMIIN